MADCSRRSSTTHFSRPIPSSTRVRQTITSTLPASSRIKTRRSSLSGCGTWDTSSMDQTVREDQKVPLEDLSGLTKKRRFGYATTALKILLIIVLVVTARLVMRRYLDQHELRQYVQLLGIVAPLAFIGLSALVVLIFIPPILLIGV